jgi:hypothetical protein
MEIENSFINNKNILKFFENKKNLLYIKIIFSDIASEICEFEVNLIFKKWQILLVLAILKIG